MDSDTKRQRVEVEETPVGKYPFIDHDRWMANFPEEKNTTFHLSEGPSNLLKDNSVSYISARPTALWFSLGQDSKVSAQARSAQYSTVAHSPVLAVELPQSEENEDGMMLYSKWDSVRKYIDFRTQKIPVEISHPFATSRLFQEAVIGDVISNAVHRDPTLYGFVWPQTLLGIPSVKAGELADLAIARTGDIGGSADQYKLPWVWESTHRKQILSAIIEGIQKTKTDLLIPFHGLILSPWMGGILFRLSQLFFKVTVVRSQLTPGWDDSCVIFCQGKRESSKFVNKSLKLLLKLIPQENADKIVWGYSVPPACFADPCLSDWLRSVNAQLMGSARLTDSSASLMELISQFRLKKFLFPDAPEKMVGFYFGSFNPVHENHVALALYAKDKLGLDRVVFVPNNDDNEEKKDVLVALNHRVNMLHARFENIEGIEVVEPKKSTRRWEAKSEIAEEYVSSIFRDSESRGTVALILGQDSWNKAVLGSSRDKVTRHFIGIAKLTRTKFFIFPRTQDSEAPVLPAPKPIRDNVQEVEGFVDPILQLSSSRLRDELKMEKKCPLGLHAAVFQYICSHNLYSD